jgi:outer membrane receptor protein involved in Fe transport
MDKNAPRLALCGCAVLLTVGRDRAAAAERPIEAEPVIVNESPLAADAAGTTVVRLPDTLPLSGRSLGAVANAIANLHLAESGAGTFGAPLTLRGLSSTPYFSDPAVAVYFDDLPLGGSFTYPTELFGFASVTVARGPQPSAFGRFGEGGVIQFRSDAPAGSAIRAAAGNYDAGRVAIQTATGQSDAVDASISSAFATRDGYIRNPQLAATVDDQQAATAAARVRYRPARTVELTLQFLGQRRRDGAQPLVPLGGPLFSVSRGREGETASDFNGFAAKMTFDTAAGRLSSTTSCTDWTLSPYRNRLVLPPTIDSQLTQSQRVWNEEMRFASDADAPLPWHLGGWYSAGTTEGTANRAIPNLFPIEVSRFAQRSWTGAIFGDATLQTDSGWAFRVAARVERIQRKFERSQTVPAPASYDDRATFEHLMPQATASYTAQRDTHLTLSIGHAARPGGWSAYTDKAALARFAAERTTSGEAGVDTLVAARTVKLSARVFDYEIRGYQIERSFTATDYLVVNASEARSTGGEVEVAWKPSAAWSVTATAGVANTTLRRFTDPFTGRDYSGRRAPYSPLGNGSLAVNYRSPAGWFCGASASLTGRTYFDEANSAAFAARAHLLADVTLGYEQRHWRVAVFVQNATDEGYYSLVVPGVRHAVPGAPRTYGLELSARW